MKAAAGNSPADELPILTKTGYRQIHLPDSSYRWAVIKTYTWSGSADPRGLIQALQLHPSFKDHYCAPGENGVGEAPIHGPYRLDAVTTDAMVPLSHAEAQRRLDEWLDESGGAEGGEDRDSAVEAALRPVRQLLGRGDVLFLPYLGENAEHDWGRVLWYFREWFVLDHEEAVLHEIAVGLD